MQPWPINPHTVYCMQILVEPPQDRTASNEILDAFVNVYGERALMAPPKVGFNILGYVVPGIALAVGALVLAIVLRRWRRAQLQPLAAQADRRSRRICSVTISPSADQSKAMLPPSW